MSKETDKPNLCFDLDGVVSGIKLPGQSFHELGLGPDLSNEVETENYLAAEGMTCGFIKGDEGHCTFSESELDEKARGERLAKWRAKLRGLMNQNRLKDLFKK